MSALGTIAKKFRDWKSTQWQVFLAETVQIDGRNARLRMMANMNNSIRVEWRHLGTSQNTVYRGRSIAEGIAAYEKLGGRNAEAIAKDLQA